MGAGASSVAKTYIHEASPEEIAAASQNREAFLSELSPEDQERFLSDLHQLPEEEREQFLANLAPEDREKFLVALQERAAASLMRPSKLAVCVIDEATRWWMLPSMQTNYVFHNEAPLMISAAA
jgi:Mg/Co/Ni transporter MgtE